MLFYLLVTLCSNLTQTKNKAVQFSFLLLLRNFYVENMLYKQCCCINNALLNSMYSKCKLQMLTCFSWSDFYISCKFNNIRSSTTCKKFYNIKIVYEKKVCIYHTSALYIPSSLLQYLVMACPQIDPNKKSQN